MEYPNINNILALISICCPFDLLVLKWFQISKEIKEIENIINFELEGMCMEGII